MSWSVPRTWVVGEVVTASIMNTHVRDNLNALLPVGAFVYLSSNYATTETTVESRFLLANGVAVSRTTYSALFNHLNALTPALPFGTGDGSTTFNLPDARGRTLYAEGEHTNVDVMGDNEGQTIANRGPHHHHQIMMEGAGSNGAEPARGNTIDAQLANTQGGGALNLPAYLVGGQWFIKYTS